MINRRSFLKAVGIAVVSPALPVPDNAITLVVHGSIDTSPATVKLFASGLDGLLREVYLPSIMKVSFDKVPIVEMIKAQDFYKDSGLWISE